MGQILKTAMPKNFGIIAFARIMSSTYISNQPIAFWFSSGQI